MPPLASRSPGSSANDSLAVLKFWLISDGIYIWEFVTNLDYEWSFIRGRQPYRWAMWVYLMSRWSTLAVVILDLVSFNITSEINCNAWTLSLYIFGVLALGSGSLLVLLRIFAIWNMQKAVVAFSTAVWLTNIGFQIAAAIQVRTVWEPLQTACVITNFETCKNSLITLFTADVVLLLVMLVGLLRLRRSGGGTFDLGRLLWKQGCVWFTIATVTELPQVVLVNINVSDTIRLMWVVPSLFIMTIAATRMYRALTSFGSAPNPSYELENTRRNAFATNSKLPSSSVVHTLQKQLEVTVHTAFEEHQMSRCGVYDGSDGHLTDKPDELSVDSKVEVLEEKTRRGVINIGD